MTSNRAIPRPVLLLVSASIGILIAMTSMMGCGSVPPKTTVNASADLSDPRLVRGQQLFDEHCNQCHPAGTTGLAPSINEKPLPVWLMKTQIRAGLGAMPAFHQDRLAADEIDDIVAYLLHLREETKRG